MLQRAFFAVALAYQRATRGDSCLRTKQGTNKRCNLSFILLGAQLRVVVPLSPCRFGRGAARGPGMSRTKEDAEMQPPKHTICCEAGCSWTGTHAPCLLPGQNTEVRVLRLSARPGVCSELKLRKARASRRLDCFARSTAVMCRWKLEVCIFSSDALREEAFSGRT